MDKWRQSLAALNTAVGLIENGSLKRDDPLLAVLLGETDARQRFLSSAVRPAAPAASRLAGPTNLPTGSAGALIGWSIPTAWETPTDKAEIAEIAAQVIATTPERSQPEIDGLVRRTREVVTAQTPTEGVWALQELGSFVGQVVTGVTTAEIVDLINRHLGH